MYKQCFFYGVLYNDLESLKILRLLSLLLYIIKLFKRNYNF